ncbi:YqzH family protein [Pseudalkalibacillus hwajinpoensis]|uniref:YqzH family protein n=1 Tax=Guptibacillus hwajinpoensis TaxID=208199 RepID=UPI00325AC9E5
MESITFTRKLVIKTLEDYFGDVSLIPLTEEEIHHIILHSLERKNEQNETPFHMIVHDLVYEYITT